ncbi:MAG TPA: hypothetical protein VN609_05535 [Propionibacteriaceae bacterium]|nr:hypothetical protein [Propionibacteriaceae bacterium]
MGDDDDVVIAMEPLFLNKEATCKALGGISRERLEQLMRAGQIVPKMIGSRVVFPLAEVRRFARECPSWEPKRL